MRVMWAALCCLAIQAVSPADRIAGTWHGFGLGAGGDSLVGDLRELPSHRLVRRIAVGRCTTRIPQCPR